jgi:hypothetical protein
LELNWRTKAVAFNSFDRRRPVASMSPRGFA